ncbi:hypothetical protein LNAOJCKE_5252 [Methylorubrum aminovorans]|uniref:Transporter n=1 Tax=Methylorubrum aminovorans TaxID=269069 RepID=A0ABQ4UMU3_9HYPH|nr:transporter [Methylorubrum aminovorans]GJE68016.1 hypothetical protein LNAOJCKE_5252 [Methylorubrum aminovorans]GMA79940.1 hypothetical protein GCM10025880_63570 [Methylorubrum aminovorans]
MVGAAALASSLAVSTGTATAGGTSAPGFTSGLPIYAIFPEGLYYINQTDSSFRTVRGVDVRVNSNIFFFYYQSPIVLADGAVSFVVAPTVVDVATSVSSNVVNLYNTYFASQISWQITDGLFFGARLGGYIPQNNGLALDYGTIEPRFGLTYLGNGWQATSNFIFGKPVGGTTAATRAPDYFLADFSVTKTFGKWALGPVAHVSTDLNRPYASYRRQNQFAVGGMVSYDFGGATLQVKLTRDVSQTNYGGKETAVWTNLIVPLSVPEKPPGTK